MTLFWMHPSLKRLKKVAEAKAGGLVQV